MCPSSLLSMGRLWPLLSKEDVEQRILNEVGQNSRQGNWKGKGLCTVYKREHNSLQTGKMLQQRERN